MTNTLLPDWITLFELTEIRYWKDYLFAASQTELGGRVKIHIPVTGNVLGAVPEADILAFNRCMGTGIQNRVDEGLLEFIKKFYRDAGVSRFFLPLFPFGSQLNLHSLLERQGFVHYNNWIKLYCSLGSLTSNITSSLSFRYATHDDRETFINILRRAFGWPDVVCRIVSSTLGKPGWKHYLALEQDQPVAVSAMHICDEVAALAIAATLPEHQGKGAQSKMIELRVRDAMENGCRFAIAETAEEKPGKTVMSFRNFIRAGFQPVYYRPNYIFYF